MDLESEPYPKRRVDAIPGLMMLVTLAALAGASWLRFGRPPTSGAPAAVGAEAPPLRLIDPQTSEPIVMVGLSDKVAWVVFWSAEAATGPTCLRELESATRRLRRHRRFAMVAAAIEDGAGSKVQAAARAAGFPRPVYLAGPETRRRFRAETADPPLHVLIDAGGQILAMARGEGAIGRIVEIARRRLDELDPVGESRFAAAGLPGPHFAALPKSRPTIPPRMAMSADQARSLSAATDSVRMRIQKQYSPVRMMNRQPMTQIRRSLIEKLSISFRSLWAFSRSSSTGLYSRVLSSIPVTETGAAISAFLGFDVIGRVLQNPTNSVSRASSVPVIPTNFPSWTASLLSL